MCMAHMDMGLFYILYERCGLSSTTRLLPLTHCLSPTTLDWVTLSPFDTIMVRILWIFRLGSEPHHHSTNSYEPIRFLQTSQNRLINIHRKSLKHISQSALFGFSKNIGHDQIWYENSVVFKAVQWLFMIKERSCKLCYIVDSLVKT